MATLEPMKWYIDDQNARNSKINEVNHKKKKEKTRYKLEKENKFIKTIKKISKKEIIIISIATGTVVVLSSALALYLSKNNNDNLDSTKVVVLNNNPFVYEETIGEEIVYENETVRHEQKLAREREMDSKKIKLSLGTRYDTVKDKLKPNEFASFSKFGEMYGVDPNLIFSIAAQESGLRHRALIPGGQDYNDNAALGICQIEKIKDRKIKAHNYLTGKEDSLSLSEDNMIDYDKNIQACAMMLQNHIEYYNGNIYLAVQAYNYHTDLVDVAISKYALESQKTVDEVMSDYEDCGWLKYIKDIHKNPKNYLSSWSYKTYGDDNYLNNVFRYYGSDKCNFYYETEITFDLKNSKIINDEKTRK